MEGVRDGGLARRVLVVDDDADLRMLLTISLGQIGWEVVTAASEDEALSVVRERSPDVVILDLGLGLGQGHGSAVLGRLKADSATSWLPIIVVSGRTDATEVEAVLRAGAHEYVTKPWQQHELEACLERALEESARVRPPRP